MSAPLAVAIGADGITVAYRRRLGVPRQAWYRCFADRGATTLDGATLSSALTELPAAIASQKRLRAVLLPPLIALRTIDFPPLTARETQIVISRDPSRYFPAITGNHAVMTRVVAREKAKTTVLAGAIAMSTIDAIRSAFSTIGIDIVSFEPGHVAWAYWARQHARDSVLIEHDLGVDISTVGDGKLLSVRRISTHRILDELAHQPECTATLFSNTPTPRLATRASCEMGGTLDIAAAIAVTYAGQDTALTFIPPDVRAHREARGRRMERRLWSASLLTFAASLGVYYQALAGKLDRLVEQRRAHAAEVAAALSTREAGERIRARLSAIDELKATRIPWTRVLADIATALPSHSHLTSFRTTSDSVQLEGVAREAVDVLSQLRTAPLLRSIRPVAPIRQQTVDSGAVIEHFTIATLIARRQTPRDSQ